MANSAVCRLVIDCEMVMSDERLSTARVLGVLSNILERLALLSACELLGSCHHLLRRTDEYRYRRLRWPNFARSSLPCHKSNVRHLYALISADKTCRKYTDLQTALFALNHSQLNAAPLCLLNYPYLLIAACPGLQEPRLCFCSTIRGDRHLGYIALTA